MPVLGGFWSIDLRLQDSAFDVGVCPGEAPPSPVWDPLRTTPVTYGSLLLTPERPALRQLETAWRTHRGGPQGPKRSQTRTWVEVGEKDEIEEAKQEAEDSSTHVAADGRLSAEGLLAERRGSYPLTDLHNSTAGHQGEVDSSNRRKVKRVLSFQRYCHASRLLRGLAHHIPFSLHLLDEDYLGQAAHMLSKVETWNFDIFLFDRLTNGNSLVTLMRHLFSIYGLVQHFHLDIVKLHRFLGMVQEDYHSQNPYHNALHAADVTQAMYCYLQEPKLAEHLSPLDVFLGLTAAATHDVDHPGVNQPFLIKTRHYLASLYQNTSVLESHHWRSTVGMLRESGLLSHLPADVSLHMEQQLGSLILATDINRQNEFLFTFREHLDQQDLDLNLPSHRHFVLQIALKCADICSPCRVWELSRQWGERVCEEFYRQGDLEKSFDLEVSPLCDQQVDSVSAIQIGFMSTIAEPLFEEWKRFTEPSPLSRTMMGHLHKNKACWIRLRLTPPPLDTQPYAKEPDGGGEDGEHIP